MQKENKWLNFNTLLKYKPLKTSLFGRLDTPHLLIKLLINFSAPIAHEIHAKTCFQKIATCFQNELISIFNGLLTFSVKNANYLTTSENFSVSERVKQTRDIFIAS